MAGTTVFRSNDAGRPKCWRGQGRGGQNRAPPPTRHGSFLPNLRSVLSRSAGPVVWCAALRPTRYSSSTQCVSVLRARKKTKKLKCGGTRMAPGILVRCRSRVQYVAIIAPRHHQQHVFGEKEDERGFVKERRCSRNRVNAYDALVHLRFSANSFNRDGSWLHVRESECERT